MVGAISPVELRFIEFASLSQMLACCSISLSYAPVFVAPPLASRSAAVRMQNHGMRPVYYDHDQEVHRRSRPVRL